MIDTKRKGIIRVSKDIWDTQKDLVHSFFKTIDLLIYRVIYDNENLEFHGYSNQFTQKDIRTFFLRKENTLRMYPVLIKEDKELTNFGIIHVSKTFYLSNKVRVDSFLDLIGFVESFQRNEDGFMLLFCGWSPKFCIRKQNKCPNYHLDDTLGYLKLSEPFFDL